MSKPTYRAEAGYVWKNPIERPGENGITRITIGFRVCRMDQMVGDEAAETVAELMNRGERASDQDALAAAAQRIVQRIEDANHYFACDADKEEAADIVRDEITRLLAPEPTPAAEEI